MSPHRDESDVLLPGLSEKPPAEWTNGSFVVPLAAGYVARGVFPLRAPLRPSFRMARSTAPGVASTPVRRSASSILRRP
mgnify:FL=1